MNAVDKWFELCKFQQQVATELTDQLQTNDLDLNEYYVLYWLSQADDQTLRLSELETKINLSQSALSRMVARLEAKDCGAIQRVVCADDRRGRYIKLTTAGQRIYAASQLQVETILEKNLKNRG